MANCLCEYEIYLPLKRADGTPVSEKEIEKIKSRLTEIFGGYTHFNQRCEGAWRVGRVTFYDEITILRVLDDGTAKFDMSAFRKTLERDLMQEEALIVARSVETI